MSAKNFSPSTTQLSLLVGLAALLAMAAKLYCAWTTFGSNDVAAFLHFAQVIDKGGQEAAYNLGPVYNHPPLVGGYLFTIHWISETWRVPFPFLLRLPSILADFTVVMVLLRFVAHRPAMQVPLGLWLVFALSPVSFMVSGFHGNTDPVVTMFLVLAAVMCLENHAVACGLFFALSLHTKVAGLIVAPVFFFFWLARGQVWRFSLVCALVLLVGWAEPLMNYPALFMKNVLGYSSYWGIWGITYWLMMTRFSPFFGHLSTELSLQQTLVVSGLKGLIMVSILLLASRRRKLSAEQLFSTLAIAWGLFFAFSPGVASQYLVWPAAFLLFFSGRWYLVVTATSAMFQFFFYNAISRGMPWYFGSSDAASAPFWRPWTTWPWLAFSIGLFVIWKQSGSPKLFSLQTCQPGESKS